MRLSTHGAGCLLRAIGAMRFGVARPTVLLLMIAIAALPMAYPARAASADDPVLDLRKSAWRVRQVIGTTEYLTAPGKVERVVYLPKKKGNIFRDKPGMDEADYTVEKAKEYLLPEGLSPDWMKPEFNDSQWVRASGALGFPDEAGRLILVRGRFEVADPARANGFTVAATYRGGLVLYLNGEEILRQDMMAGQTGLEALGEPYPESAHLRADGRVLTRDEAMKRPEWERSLKAFKVPPAKLRKGVNVFAAAVHRAPLDKVCLLRGNSQGRTIATGAGEPIGWPTVGLRELVLTAPSGSAPAGDLGPAKLVGLRLWTQNAAQNVFANDPGDLTPAPYPVRMASPRGGTACGMVIAGAPAAIKGLKAQVTDLKGPAVIPASAVDVRYLLPDGSPRQSRDDERGPAGFDTLAEEAPAEIPLNGQTALAIQPLRLVLRVPKGIAAGDYTGTLTVSAAGQEPVTVRLALQVAGWTLPPAGEYATHMDIFQSPDSVAMQYGVEMWSDEHLRLLDRTFSLLGPLGTKTLYITAIRRTHLGNEHAMVQWTRGRDGQLEPDLGVVERYLDVACKHLGKIPSVVLYAWEPPESQGHAGNPNSPGRQHDRPILLTLVSAKTGQRRPITGPEWGTPESAELWGKLTLAMNRTLANRGMTNSLLFGLMGDHRPTKAAMDEISNAAPATLWAVHSHYYCLEHNGYKVGLCSSVWGIGCAPLLPEFGESGYGWRSKFRLTLNSRYDLRQHSPISTYMTLPEKWLGARAGNRGAVDYPLNGTKGMGRMGADFWHVLKDQRGIARERLCGRYPEAAWGQLSLGNCATALLSPGPREPMATVRSEALRECVQAMEARVFIERALLDTDLAAKLGDDLISRCHLLIDNRRRALHYGGDFFVGADWVDAGAKLYALAQEVGEKSGIRK